MKEEKRAARIGAQEDKREEMLEKFNQIHIALDPFPYSGITTSLEGIWMGVPLLTKVGNNFYSRIGVGINKNLNMEILRMNCLKAFLIMNIEQLQIN